MLEPSTEAKLAQFNPKKPKVSLRRFTDEWDRLAINQYILNRGTQGEAYALENVYRILGRERRPFDPWQAGNQF